MNFRTKNYYEIRLAKLIANGEEMNRGLIAKVNRQLRKIKNT